MLRSAGLLGKVDVIGIGSGWADAARGFIDDSGIDAKTSRLRMLADPERAAYTHLQLNRGVVRTFTWRKWANLMGFLGFPYECCCRRRMPGLNAGDPWQQGGTFVFAAGGKHALLEHREESPGWPALDQEALVSAARSAIAFER